MLSPGLLTTVQDLGRPGYARFGVSASGAADALSFRAGNRLVGNAENAAALEMTLAGGSFEFEGAATVALTGSDFGAPRWRSFNVAAGQVLRFGATKNGARAYLCVNGGIEVPPVLGSRSTHQQTGLGGFEGRALKKGDVLCLGAATGAPLWQVNAAIIESMLFRRTLRITRASQSSWFSDDTLALLCNSDYEVSEESNRVGLRLRGQRLAQTHPRQLLTEGAPLGAIQVPAGGEPIIIFVESQTTGGYPKIANIISADLPAVGQLRPRDKIRFEVVSIERALSLLREQEEMLRGLV